MLFLLHCVCIIRTGPSLPLGAARPAGLADPGRGERLNCIDSYITGSTLESGWSQTD
jgi:hypothetical protein